jgi:dTDP-3,4-didehydro-2,6-dideoxy-alpha-D-glucose 3-reductase
MPKSIKTIGVGVWGLGQHARRKILPALSSCSATVLVGVTTRNMGVACEEADRYGCSTWSTPEDMLNDASVEAVCVATPSGLHASHGLRVLRSGRHLWCEKPIAATLAEAQALSEASRQESLALCEGLMYLYNPHFSLIANMISGNSIGAVLSVRSQFGIPALKDPGFRTDPSLGGGALLDLAPYPLSATLGLIDEPWDLVDSSVHHLEGHEVDMSGHALLATGARKTVAFLEWGYSRAYRNEISVWGEHGSIQSDFIFSKPADYSPVVSLRDQYGRIERIHVDSADSFDAMFHSFSDAVFDATVREGLRRAIEVRAGFLGDIRRQDWEL